ncbi:MAG: HAMP domain-containing histidine kinase, partial [Planctomycetes bacterium]|nr:HAMP domain-containing histidine kinase [Planctomycetota bacterium]
LGFPFDLLSMLLLALGGSALLLRCEGVVVPWASALLAVLTLCLSFLAFSVLYVWIPVGGFLLLGGILGIASLYGKVALAGALSRQVLIESRPEEGKPEEPLAATDLECWPLIAGLINQTLHLNRCLLLEKQPGSDSLKNAISLNCTFNDIGERRRDCCRTPYITAKEAGGPIRVESFLLKPLGKELQYIAPLEHAGDLLGFWVLGVDESRVPSGAFERLISDYAAIISQMVYHHRIRQRERSVARRLEMCLAHDQTSFVYGHLKQSVGQLKRKLRSTEIIIDKIQTATVVFNLFGDIVSMNRRMKALIVQERLKPRRLTALDFLSALTEYDADKAKKVLRHVLLDRQALTMPAKLSSGGSGKHLMHLQPLHLGEAAADGEDARDLAARGILCEVVDARSFTEVYEMKESLARRLGTHLRNELASIDISSALIAESWVSEEQKVHAARLAQEKVSRSMELIVECQQYFDGSRELETLERFPVSSLDAFREALRQVQPLLAQKRLEVQVESPRLMSHCLASRESLSTAFTVLLKLLIGDAMDNSRIEVSAVESEDLVVYELRNHGFGIPNERFQEFLFGEKPQAAGNLKMLRDCIHWAESWGGELEAGSEVGVGTSARLGLVKFI